MSSSLGKPPQSFLDRIHVADVSACFSPRLQRRQRQSQMRFTRDTLAEVREELTNYLNYLQQASDNPRALIPYRRLLGLVENAERALNHLEETLEAGKLLPKSVKVPRRIFGSEERGEWYFGDDEGFKRFEYAEQIRRRLINLMKERDPMRNELQVVKGRMDALSKEYARLDRIYQRRKRPRYFWRVVLFLLLVSVGMFVGAAFTMGIVQFALIGFGVALLLLILPLWRTWRRDLRKRDADLKALRDQIKEVSAEGRKLQMRYLPLNDMCEEMRAEYAELRRGFA